MLRNQERIEAELRARHGDEIKALADKTEKELHEQERAALEAFNLRQQQVFYSIDIIPSLTFF